MELTEIIWPCQFIVEPSFWLHTLYRQSQTKADIFFMLPDIFSICDKKKKKNS